MRSDVSLWPATKYPIQLVVTAGGLELLEACWARTPGIQIEPKSSSARLGPTILAIVVFIYTIGRDPMEFYSLLPNAVHHQRGPPALAPVILFGSRVTLIAIPLCAWIQGSSLVLRYNCSRP